MHRYLVPAINMLIAKALVPIMPEELVVDPSTPLFGLSARQIGRKVKAAAEAAGRGDGFTSHSGRVGMAKDMAKTGAELPELLTAGRWKSSTCRPGILKGKPRTEERWPGDIRTAGNNRALKNMSTLMRHHINTPTRARVPATTPLRRDSTMQPLTSTPTPTG